MATTYIIAGVSLGDMETLFPELRYTIERVRGGYTMADGSVVVEESIMVTDERDHAVCDMLERVVAIGRIARQESILMLADGTGYVIYCATDEYVNIGAWVCVGDTMPMDVPGWTQIGGKFYTCRK